MKTYVVLYEGFANFEIVVAMHLLKTAGDLVTIALNNEALTSAEGLKVLPDGLIHEVTLTEDDVLLIPGGDPSVLNGAEDLYQLIRQGDKANALLAAICAAPTHFAKAGILEDREYTTSMPHGEDSPFNSDLYVHQNVVVDEHIVTAQPSGYAEFGIVLGQLMDIYKNEEDLDETVRFFMDFEIQ